jgi:molybdopterin molybdotransferase
MALIDVATAQELVSKNLHDFGEEQVTLTEACGRVLREPVLAERDQPPFDRVTMDGIAIASGDFAAGTRRFRIVGIQAAGQPPPALDGPATCVEVMTGAVLPDGCDAVVPVEELTLEGEIAHIERQAAVQAGCYVHRRASDHSAGTLLLPSGTRLAAPELAILALAGKATVRVARAPRVAVICTGDELKEVDEPLAAHEIRNTNAYGLTALLQARAIRAVSSRRLADDPAAMHAELSRLLESEDVLVISGGVSKGKFDYVPAVLKRIGVREVFHRIAQRPGKPMWFGVAAGGQLVFGLPGNPVSSLVCLRRYVIPALEAAMGLQAKPQRVLRLTEDVDFSPPLTLFLPVTARWDAQARGLATPRPTNTSGDLTALAGTDGFVELPAEASQHPAGCAVPFFSWH